MGEARAKIAAAERALGLHARASFLVKGGRDIGTGSFCDVYLIVAIDGRTRIYWTNFSADQPDPLPGSALYSDTPQNSGVRVLTLDERPEGGRRIPADFLFRSALARLAEMAGAGPEHDTAERSALRAEARAFNISRLKALGIDPAEVEAATEVGKIS